MYVFPNFDQNITMSMSKLLEPIMPTCFTPNRGI